MKEWKEGDTCYYWGKSIETTPRKGTITYISTITDTCRVKTETCDEFYASSDKLYTLQEIYERKMETFHNKLEEAKQVEEFYKNAISDLQRYYEKEINKEQNKKEICKNCTHFRPEGKFCAFTNRVLKEWEINHDSGVCFRDKEED